MKFGEILLCTNIEKAVIGDKYIFSDKLKPLVEIKKNGELALEAWGVTVQKATLSRVSDEDVFPFEPSCGGYYQFALEVREEKVYRPYESLEELIEDYKRRFNVKCGNNPPFIWVKTKSEMTELIIGFEGCHVRTSSYDFYLSDLFTEAVFMDGSPCGKKVEE